MEIWRMSGFQLRLKAAQELEKVRNGWGVLAISDAGHVAKTSVVAKRSTTLQDGPQVVETVLSSEIQSAFSPSSGSSLFPPPWLPAEL